LWRRLERLGLAPGSTPGIEDESFSRAGNGLTDVVKRPTASASEVRPEELEEGAKLLVRKVKKWKPGLVLFAFKGAAEAATGRSPMPGAGLPLAGVPTFLFTGPYAPASEATRVDAEFLDLMGRKGIATSDTKPSPASQRARVKRISPMSGKSAVTTAVSQPVTAVDKENGRIRFPRQGKAFFPDAKTQVWVVLGGVRMQVPYDPRLGPDKERSAVLRVGKGALASAGVGERLSVSRRPDGNVSLD
jgi:hypothetical protein